MNWLVPSAALRVFVAMILYELQLDAGAGSRAIHFQFLEIRFLGFGASIWLDCPEVRARCLQARGHEGRCPDGLISDPSPLQRASLRRAGGL